MATLPEQVRVRIEPNEIPVAPPYANTSFSYTNTASDVTILFLRAPLLADPDIARLKEANPGAEELVVKGAVVASVTMPRDMMRDLVRRLAEALDKAAGEEPTP